jgi:hypothetical protein
LPDHATIVRTLLTVGTFFGPPLSILAYVRLRHYNPDRVFRRVVATATLLFIAGLTWSVFLVAPPGNACLVPLLETATFDVPCELDSLAMLRGSPFVDAVFMLAIGIGLFVVALDRWCQGSGLDTWLRDR